jgi:putative ABC transport system substrate-binding protein
VGHAFRGLLVRRGAAAQENFPNRIPTAVAAELVRLEVEAIVTGGGAATRAAKEASAAIPIVTSQDPDPVANGFVAGLARPGGNITGLSTYAPELSVKRPEILREGVPKLSRVAVLGTSTQPGYTQVLKEIEPAANAFGVKLEYLDVLDSRDVETALRAASTRRADGALTLNSPVLSSERKQLVTLAVKNQLPIIYHQAGSSKKAG